ncbi:hypothetical protein KAS31_01835 [Candidatus Parcubacteria bacterium]|nr:hypothetical protein [Candidatus Parcubacteria bacterium]
MDTQTDDMTVTMESLEKRAEDLIDSSAEFIVNQLLQTITDEESKRLYLKEKIGKTIMNIGQKKLDKVGTAEKESVVRKLKERGIEISLLSDSDFPDDMEKGGWNCCIFFSTKTIVA